MKRNKKMFYGAVALMLVMAGLYLSGTVFAQPEVYQIGSDYLVFNGDGSSIVGEYPDPPDDAPDGQGSATVTREIVMGFSCMGTEIWFGEILPSFAKYWKEKTGERVVFTTGWNSVGPDSVATVIYGKPAEIEMVIATMDGKSRGFDGTKKWKASRNDAVYTHPIVFVVRKGNPKNIRTYADLARPEIQVLHMDPFGTHGGIKTAFGLYGAILKESEEKTGKKDYAGASEFVKQIEEKAVTEFSGPMVRKLFDRGIGDVMVTTEPTGIKMDKNPKYEMVMPPNTVSIDLTAYLIRKNIPQEDRRVVNAFVDYLFSEPVQEAFANGGFRPTDPAVLARHPEFRPTPGVVYADYLGDNPSKVTKELLLGSVHEGKNKYRPEEEKVKVKKLRPKDLPDFSKLPVYQQVPD